MSTEKIIELGIAPKDTFVCVSYMPEANNWDDEPICMCVYLGLLYQNELERIQVKWGDFLNPADCSDYYNEIQLACEFIQTETEFNAIKNWHSSWQRPEVVFPNKAFELNQDYLFQQKQYQESKTRFVPKFSQEINILVDFAKFLVEKRENNRIESVTVLPEQWDEQRWIRDTSDTSKGHWGDYTEAENKLGKVNNGKVSIEALRKYRLLKKCLWANPIEIPDGKGGMEKLVIEGTDSQNHHFKREGIKKQSPVKYWIPNDNP